MKALVPFATRRNRRLRSQPEPEPEQSKESKPTRRRSADGLARDTARLRLLLSVALGLWLAACNACSDLPALASLERKSGSVDRDEAAHVGEWSDAPVGAEFQVGDGIRSGQTSGATVRLADGASIELEEATVLRFLNRASESEDPGVDVEMGRASVQTHAQRVNVHTAQGVAKLEPGSQVIVRREGDALRFEVSVGLATLSRVDGSSERIEPGQGIELRIGNAELQRFALAGPNPPAGSSTTSTRDATPGDAASPSATSVDGPIRARLLAGSVSLKAAGDARWQRQADPEFSVESGTSLRLGKGARVGIQRGDQRALLLGSGTFAVGDTDGALVRASSGQISLNGGPGTVTVNVPGGRIVAETGARANVAINHKSGSKVRVEAGVVRVQGKDVDERLRGGEELTLSPNGDGDVAGRSLPYHEFALTVGGSATLHDPSPPTVVGFATSGVCPGASAVKLASAGSKRAVSSARGQGQINLTVPKGAYRYGIHCVSEAGVVDQVAAKEGHVVVLHDAGTARLPRTPPPTRVDTDGRSYTVLYQNQLPKISVKWPRAPQAAGYTLRVQSPARAAQTLASGKPSYAFPAGRLGEGTHRLTFSGAGKTSKTTTLHVRFDNAAPKASLSSPADRSFSAGSSVTVSGLALPGWTVSVGGTTVPQDSQHRFSGTVSVPGGSRAMAIQFSHPQRGTHHYLRRAR